MVARPKLLAATIAGLSLLAPQPEARAASATGQARHGDMRLAEGQHVLAPFGYIRFCLDNPDDCRDARPAPLEWTAATQRLVSGINAHVNRSIRPANDIGDEWVAEAKQGDCEDFVLAKRRRLLAAGLPASALRIAVATTRRGEGHAVLVLRTGTRDLVLDNRTNVITDWYEADLNWLKISSAENPRLWRAVSRKRLR